VALNQNLKNRAAIAKQRNLNLTTMTHHQLEKHQAFKNSPLAATTINKVRGPDNPLFVDQSLFKEYTQQEMQLEMMISAYSGMPASNAKRSKA
jgi:hypothetical protein